MREIAPGILHWTAYHDPIGQEVSSYYVEPAGLVIDPKLPEEGLDALPGRPTQVVLTTGLHDRDARAVADHFGIPIRVSEEGAERIGDALPVEAFAFGEEIADGVTALRIGVLCPDEGALHIALGDGAISLADGAIRADDGLGFVPDFLLGDDPEGVKAGLREVYAGLLERDFAHVLLAHGDPIVGDGRAALAEFAGR